jgi:hypothetical protein
MCHERWVRHRDEAVANSWLRDLVQPGQRTSPTPEDVSAPAADEPLTERDAVGAAATPD